MPRLMIELSGVEYDRRGDGLAERRTPQAQAAVVTAPRWPPWPGRSTSKGVGMGNDARTRWNGNRQAQRRYQTLGTCERCGLVPATDRHHRNRDTFDNRRANVEFLCAPCHGALHTHESQGAYVSAARKRALTACKHGHPFTPENTRIKANGCRCCKTCDREQQRRRWASRSGGASQSHLAP